MMILTVQSVRRGSVYEEFDTQRQHDDGKHEGNLDGVTESAK